MDLRVIARRQRIVHLCILISVLSLFLPLLTGSDPDESGWAWVWWILIFGLLPVYVTSVVMLMSAVKRAIGWKVLYGFLAALPFANLLGLVMASMVASHVMARAGIRMGLTGARKKDIRLALGQDVCPYCGHEMTEDVSGVCPSCSRSVSQWLNDYDLRLVAKRQRFLTWCILLSIGSLFMSLADPGFVYQFGSTVMILVTIGYRIVVISGLVMLMSALNRHIVSRIVFGVLAIIPLINLLLLLSLNSEATRVLKAAGLKVRLMGVPDEDVRRIVELKACSTCGYDLTGNVSGICPECGSTVMAMV